MILPNNFAGDRVYLNHPGVAKAPPVGTVIQQKHIAVWQPGGVMLMGDLARSPLPVKPACLAVHQPYRIEDAKADEEFPILQGSEIVGPSPR